MEEKETGQSAKNEIEETKKAEDQIKKKAEPPAKETGAELYKGIVKLTIVPPVDSGQISKLEEHLCQVQDLRLVLISGSMVDGTEIVVSAETPLSLLDILREMPSVAQVAKKVKTIQITLKAA